MLKNLILLFAFSSFVTFVWIGTSVYHNTITSKISQSNQIRIEPIDPSFDMETLQSLTSREEVTVNLSDQLTIISEDGDLSTATQGAQTVNQLSDPIPVTAE